MCKTPREVRTKSGELLRLIERPGGFACPVCGRVGPGSPAYDWTQALDGNGKPVGQPFASASFDVCPACEVQYGVDDYVEGGLISEQWCKLRLKWLDRVGWSREAVLQLKTNLEIDVDALQRAKGQQDGDLVGT